MIEKGLAKGAQVVVDGQYRLDEGSKVGDQAPPAAQRSRFHRLTRNEPVAPVHPAADRDDAADRCGAVAGADRLPGCCPWRRCRTWIFPTIQVVTGYPGASPDGDGNVRHGAAGTLFRPDRRPDVHELHQLRRDQPDHAAIQPRRAGMDAAAQDVQAQINASSDWVPTVAAADAADLPGSEPGRHAGADPGADLRHFAAARRGRLRRDGAGAETVPGRRRRRGDDGRRPAPRGAAGDQPGEAWPASACRWRTCAAPSPPRQPICRKAA